VRLLLRWLIYTDLPDHLLTWEAAPVVVAYPTYV